MKKIMFLFFLTSIITSCFLSSGDIFVSGTKVNDSFFITDMPDTDVKSLYHGQIETGGESVLPYVESVGFNDDYVIAKDANDKYYIIQYKENNDPKGTMIGPLKEEDFESKRNDLGIDDIEFSITL